MSDKAISPNFWILKTCCVRQKFDLRIFWEMKSSQIELRALEDIQKGGRIYTALLS